MKINETALLANLPIYVDNIPIYSPILREIAKMGMEEYNTVLCLATYNKNYIKEPSECSNFELLRSNYNNKEFANYHQQALEFFTHHKFEPINYQNNFYLYDSENKYFIFENNYNNFINAICISCCNEEIKNEEDLDEFDKRCLAAEKKIREIQNKDENDEITFNDLVSYVANITGNDLNIINIWDLNIFQFRNQLNVGQTKENFYMNFRKYLVGVDPKDLEMKYFITSNK